MSFITAIRRLTSLTGRSMRGSGHSSKSTSKQLRIDLLEDRYLLSGGIIEYQTPAPLGGPSSLAVAQDGSIWFTEFFGGTIGRFFPAEERFVRYTIPTPQSTPLTITPDSDGNMWFTEYGGNKVGKITPQGVVEREYPLPLPNCGPAGIVEGLDGRLWITAQRCQRIMALSPSTGQFATYSLFANSGPQSIIVGPDGNLWFADSSRHTVGSITTGGILLPEISLPPGEGPLDLALAADGKVWYTRWFGADRVGTISPDRFFVAEYVVQSGCNPHSVAARHDGTQWFACFSSSTILRLSAEGYLLGEFRLPSLGVEPNAIAVDQDGNVWVSELLPSRIAKVFEYPILAEGVYLTGTVGQPVADVVATFTDTDPTPHSEFYYSAFIYWGDGAVTVGQVLPSGPHSFTVSGFHEYSWEGLFEITVVVVDFSPFYTPAYALSYAEITEGGSSPGSGAGWSASPEWIDLALVINALVCERAICTKRSEVIPL